MYRPPQTLMEVLGAREDVVLAHTRTNTRQSVLKELEYKRRIEALLQKTKDDGATAEMTALILKAVAEVVTTSMERAEGGGGGGGSGGGGSGSGAL
jgi:hypothetical protein